MISVMSWEQNGYKIEVVYDEKTGFWVNTPKFAYHRETFEKASQKMDEVIQELLRERQG